MANVIVAPTEVPFAGRQIFLAGAIDMGAAVDWQAQVIEAFRDDDVVLLNPRRKEDFTPDMLDEQVIWELHALKRANLVFMWFPKDAKAPISFFEAGLYWHTQKLIVGAEPGFYRRRNLELTSDVYGGIGQLYDSIPAMVIAARRRVGLDADRSVSR